MRIAAFISLPLLIIGIIFVKKRLPPREPGPLIDVSFFSDPRYCLFVAAQFLVLWGNWTPYFFVQTIAAQVGIPRAIDFYLLAIINGLSLPGRVIPGIIADKVGPFNVFIPSALSAGILTYALIGIHTPAGLYIYCVLYGLMSGAVISLLGPCCGQICPDMRKIGTMFGMVTGISSWAYVIPFCFVGLAYCRTLTGTPIAGALVTRENGGFTGALVFSGTVMILGGLCTLAASLMQMRKEKKIFVHF